MPKSHCEPHQRPARRTIGTTDTDKCQNLDGEKMNVDTLFRRTFDNCYAWEDLGGPEKLNVYAKYQPGVDTPQSFRTYPRIASFAERKQEPGTVRVFEVGLVIADNPEKYAVVQGGARSKERDDQPIQRGVLDREPRMLRVVAKETLRIAKKAQMWALCELQDDHFTRRYVNPKCVFFYSEFMAQIPASTKKNKRQAIILNYINRYAAREQLPEEPTQAQEISTAEQTENAESTPSEVNAHNPLKLSEIEIHTNETPSAPSFEPHNSTDLHNSRNVRGVHENIGQGTHTGQDTKGKAVIAFFDWGNPLTVKNAETLAKTLQSSDPTAPRLSAILILFAREVLARPSSKPATGSGTRRNKTSDQPSVGQGLSKHGLPFFLDLWHQGIISTDVAIEDAERFALGMISLLKTHCRWRSTVALRPNSTTSRASEDPGNVFSLTATDQLRLRTIISHIG